MQSVHLRLTGGLGNQLFQFAFAFSKAQSRGCKLYIHISYMNNFLSIRNRSKFVAKRDFILNDLGLVNFANIEIVNFPVFPFNYLFGKIRVFRIRLIRHFIRFFFGAEILDGYFVTPIEFSVSESQIGMLKTIIKKKYFHVPGNICAVHVRAGDTLNLSVLKCSFLYYSQSMAFVKKNTSVKEFIIVSEDVNYAKSLLMPLQSEYVLHFKNEQDQISDFYTLMSYDYLISANSTFSWWAGVLGKSIFFICTPFIYKENDKPKVSKEIIFSH